MELIGNSAESGGDRRHDEPALVKMEYRLAIDGLRAVAVLSVMAFHLSPELLPGGFLGVDVFFVISGFLITSIVYEESARGEFSFLKFYQRRIARIFPILFLVLLATCMASFFLYPGEDIASTGAASVAALASLANMKFMTQGDYFKLEPDTTPLLHTWSLSVEEQFYLCLPPTLYGLSKLKNSSVRTRTCLWLLLLVSFAFSLWLTYRNHAWAFYLMPSRAWELLAGGLAACSLPQVEKVKGISWRVVCLLGILGICFSIVWFRESSDFPGWIVPVPVLATVLFLLSERYVQQGVLISILRSPAMVSIGKASYSLYLWHWPVYSFVDYRLLLQPTVIRTVIKLAATIFLTMLFYRVLEVPLRRYFAHPSRRFQAYSSFVVASVLLALLSFQLWKSQYLNSTVASSRLGGIVINESSKAPHVVLYGDSTASMYGKQLGDLAKKKGFQLNILSVAGENPLLGSRLFQNSSIWLESQRIDNLIVGINWLHQTDDEACRELLKALKKYGNRIVVLNQPPTLPDNASRNWIREHGLSPVRESPDVLQVRKKLVQWIEEIDDPKIVVLDVNSMFVKEDGTIRLFGSAGEALFQDRLHLSSHGALEVIGQLQL